MVNKKTGALSSDDPLLGLTGYVLRRASLASQAKLGQRLAPLELRPYEATLLLLVEASPGVTQSEAGRLLDIQRANMVPVVARLAARGLIQRKPVDGRSQGLWVTRSGQTVMQKVRRIVVTDEAALMRRIPEEMQPMVLPILMALWNPQNQ
jgi:DNA-binding MarR family transcriptional regulator